MKISNRKRPFMKAFTAIILLLSLSTISRISAQILSATPSTRCNAGVVTLHASASSGTIQWYEVPFYGTPIPRGTTAKGTVSEDGTTFTTPSMSVTKTYYADALDGSGCSLNPGKARIPVIATVTSGSILTNIYYTSQTYCNSLNVVQNVTLTGSAGGSFSVAPSGLTVNPVTGSFNPSAVAENTYTVTYHIVTPVAGCLELDATTEVRITTAPVQPEISYSGSPFCTTNDAVTVNRTGVSGGIYSASPSGLTIDVSSGTITPASSFSGHYTITYFKSGTGGCAPMTATTTVDILQLPTSVISYSSTSYTKNQGSQSVSLSGTGVYTGGTYTASPAGLSINASNGAINPSESNAGGYTVSYALSAASPCAAPAPATTGVTIYGLPTATIGGSTTVCQNSADPAITLTGANGVAPYTFVYMINSGPELTATTSTGSSITLIQPTALTGTYTYSLVSVTDNNGATQLQIGSASITVSSAPVASFTYEGSPYCSSGINPTPTMLEGGVKGTFSVAAGDATKLLFVDSSTGEINLTGSTAGTYLVTNTIAAAAGCPVVTATANITVTKLPVATFSYPVSSYCTSGTDPVPVLESGASNGIYSSSPAGIAFVSTSTGEIDLSASTPGSYTVTNTVIAAGGCSDVTANFSLSIVAQPSTPVIAYSGSPYCNSLADAQPVELTGTSGGTYSYTVTSGGETLTISEAGAITPSSSSPGVYLVKYSVGGGGGCAAAEATAPVTIYQTPAVTSANTKAICSGSNTAITLTASIESTFTWILGTVSDNILDASVGSGSEINQVLINTSYTQPRTVQYIVTATSSANGCIGAPYTITVTVNPKPLVMITNPTVCAPSTISPSASGITAGSTADLTFTYWTNYAATTTFSNSVLGSSGTYFIKGTTTLGCSSVGEVTATINLQPDAPTTENVTVIYNGSAHTGTATAPGGSTVAWYTAANGGTATVVPSGTNVGTYTAWAQSVNSETGCTSAARTQVTVQINKGESTITATGATSYFYTGEPQGPATSTITGSGGTLSYSYSGTGSTTYDATATKPTDTGTYQVIATVAADANFNTASSAAYAFVIYPMPQGSLTANGPFCASGAGKLTWTATTGTGPYTVKYNDGTAERTATAVTSGTEFNAFTTPVTSSNTYTLVSVTDANGAARSADFTGSSATITVNPQITGNTSGADVTICDGTSTTLVGGAVTGGSGTYSYSWYSSTSITGSYNLAAGTNSEANYTTSTELYYKRKVTSGACVDLAAAVKVTVIPCPGVTAKYYTGFSDLTVLPDYTSNYSGTDVQPTPNFVSADGVTILGSGAATNVAVVCDGYINLPAAGTWTFSVISDDGFRLTVNGTVVTQNNSKNNLASTYTGTITVGLAGRYSFRSEYFNATGPAMLSIEVSNTGNGYVLQELPTGWLVHD